MCFVAFVAACSPHDHDTYTPSGPIEAGSTFESLLDGDGELQADLVAEFGEVDLGVLLAAAPAGLRRFHQPELIARKDGSTELTLRSLSQMMTLDALGKIAARYQILSIELLRSARYAPASWDVSMSVKARAESSAATVSAYSTFLALLASIGNTDINQQVWLERCKVDRDGSGILAVSVLNDEANVPTHSILRAAIGATGYNVLTSDRIQSTTGNPRWVEIKIGGRSDSPGAAAASHADGLVVGRDFGWSPRGASTAQPLPRDNDNMHRVWKAHQVRGNEK